MHPGVKAPTAVDATGVVVSQREDWPCQSGIAADRQISERGRSQEYGRSPGLLRLCVQFPKAASSTALSSADPGAWELGLRVHKSFRVAIPSAHLSTHLPHPFLPVQSDTACMFSLYITEV